MKLKGRPNKKQGPWRNFCILEAPSFLKILISLEGNRSRTRKGIQFWIERLIINSAGELNFSETYITTSAPCGPPGGARAALNWEPPSTVFIKIYRGIAVT